MNNKSFYYIEINMKPISKDPYVRFKSFKIKGFISCKKKDLEQSIKYIAQSTIDNITDDALKSVEWSVTKQQSMPYDFIFDPDLKKKRDEEANKARGEKPQLSVPPESKIISRLVVIIK